MKPSRAIDRVRNGVRWSSTGVVTTAVGVLLLFCTDGHTSKAQQPSPAGEHTSTVQVAAPKKQAIRREIVQPGVVKSYEEVAIQSKIAGFVEKVNVDIGDRIKKGDLLAKLVAPELEEDLNVKKTRIAVREADLKQAKIAVTIAEAVLEVSESQRNEAVVAMTRAEANHARWDNEVKVDNDLVGKGVLDRQTLDEAINQQKAAEAALSEAKSKVATFQATLKLNRANREKAATDVEIAQANIDVAKAEYQERKVWLDYTNIRAPFDGIVTRCAMSPGIFVQPPNAGVRGKETEALLVVERVDMVRAVVQVPENDAPFIKDGAAASIRLPALENREIACKVTRTAWSLDEKSRTLRVEIVLDNSKQELRSGMYGTVSISAAAFDTMTLPVDAILSDGAVKYCLLIENGKATRRNVRVGTIADAQVEVLAKQTPPAKTGEEGTWEKFTGTERAIIFDLSSIPKDKTFKAK
jgi:multidrug efflux pump subunit AcrA (membrane-fusion protein)